MVEGMLPIKLFLERSMIRRLCIYPINSGMIPVIWLPERKKKRKCGMDPPILAGIGLENVLLDRSSERHPGFGRGIGPSKRLELKSIDAPRVIFH